MAAKTLVIPRDATDIVLNFGDKQVRLTNLKKLFWKKLKLTKRDLLQYYADISPWLLPHLADRAMVMKRYPNGAEGDFFYMKRAPEPRPEWIEICAIPHTAGRRQLSDRAGPPLAHVAHQPRLHRSQSVVRAVRRLGPPRRPALRSRSRPGATFDNIRQVALRVRDILDQLSMPTYAKTTGSKGIHVYIPIVRGPLQKEVWTFAKAIAIELETRHPDIITAEYRKVKRPHGRVLVDYNQNAWGRTLASIYSVRPTPVARFRLR